MFYLSRSEQIALFALLALLLGGAGVFAYARGRRSARAGAGEPILVPAPVQAGEVVVQVSGAVGEPGVYRLPAGSRTADALARAGGAAEEADLSGLNLAAQLYDGDRIIIPRQGGPQRSAWGASPQTAGSLGRISLNRATREQLESLPGIGPTLAQRIIAHRERKMREEGHGFQSVEELLEVDGIGPKRFAAIQDLVAP